MAHRLGIYYAPAHDRAGDWAYLQALNPPAVRVLAGAWPDAHTMRRVAEACPDALLLPRNWSISETHDEIRRDPAGVGREHARAWHECLARWGLPDAVNARMVVVGQNEPHVWNDFSCVPYTVALLEECTRLGLRACALNLSVGWPANHGPDTPPDWQPFEPIRGPLERNGGYLVCHEYWSDAGPAHMGGWWAWRVNQCPWPEARILIGECGVDQAVAGAGLPYHQRGWQGRGLSPEQYAAQLAEYVNGLDARVVGVLPFLTDYQSGEWQSFDTGPAHDAIVARSGGQTEPRPGPQPSKPQAPSGPHVSVPAGANVRQGPGTTHSVVRALPLHTEVQPDGRNAAGDWLRLRAPVAGWVSAALLAGVPDGLPVVGDGGTVYLPVVGAPSGPQDAERNWQRSIDFVLRWEGGYQNVPNDSGNWTGGAVGKGENRGTKYGISAARYPHLDIRNLTLDRAKVLYRRDYWQASGADKQPWPLCLLVMDTAVLHGVGAATTWLREVGPNPLAFAAKRLRVYVGMGNWDYWGKAWVRRVADLLEAMKGE